MSQRTGQIILAAAAAVLVVFVAYAAYEDGHPAAPDEQSVDIVGDWHLVASESFDQDARVYETVNHRMDITVTGTVGNIFYGTTQDTAFTGAFVEGNVIFEYYTDYGAVRAMGAVADGNIVTKEVHYYSTASGVESWYVFINVYSKDSAAQVAIDDSTPDINLSWSAWNGFSLDSAGTVHSLRGASLLMYEQRGSFFRAEMEQDVGTGTVTRALIGVMVNAYDVNGTTTHMAYVVEETGTLWNMYIRDDVLVLRCVKASEVASIAGEPVAAERLYRNSSIPGEPAGLLSEDALQGVWQSTHVTEIAGDGTVTTGAGSYHIDYSNHVDTLFTGTGTFTDGDGTYAGQEVAYSVVNKTLSAGYLYHTYSVYAGEGYSGTGYLWMSGNGHTMYQISFWNENYKGGNGVTMDVFEKQ